MKSLARGAVNVFSNFLNPTYVNCRVVSGVVSLYSRFLLFSLSSCVLLSGIERGLV